MNSDQVEEVNKLLSLALGDLQHNTVEFLIKQDPARIRRLATRLHTYAVRLTRNASEDS